MKNSVRPDTFMLASKTLALPKPVSDKPLCKTKPVQSSKKTTNNSIDVMIRSYAQRHHKHSNSLGETALP